MRFVEAKVTPTFAEEERLDCAPMTHIVDTTAAHVVALVAIDQPDDIRLVLGALNGRKPPTGEMSEEDYQRMFGMPSPDLDAWIAKAMEERFPWLNKLDDDEDAEFPDSGADVIDQLSEWFQELRNADESSL